MILWTLLRFAGSKTGILAVSVLAAFLTFFFLIQYGRNIERTTVETQELETYQETRRNIDEAVRNSPTTATDALDFLRRRQQQ